MRRAQACPVSCSLPGADVESEFAARGTEIHAFVDEALRYSRDEALARVSDDNRAVCAAINVDHLPVDAEHEVALAVNVACGTVRFLGRNIGRRYGELLPSEIPTSIDVLGRDKSDPAGKAYVLDYKTGFRDVEPPHRNAQLRFQALAVARWMCVSQVRVGIVTFDDDGEPVYKTDDIDAFDLDDIEQEARHTYQAAVAAVGSQSVRIGPWCRYCPARMVSCPAMRAFVEMTLGSVSAADAAESATALLHHGNAGDVYHQACVLRDASDLMLGVVRDLARTKPVDLGGGVELVVQEYDATTIDPEVARPVLERYGGAAAIKQTVSKAAIKEHIGDKVAEREAMAEIYRLGGVKVRTKTRMVERQSKK
jgi:hypothetical protein